MSSLVSSVIANIYVKYFEELAIDPGFPIPTLCWKIYVDDIINISKPQLTEQKCLYHS